MNININLITCVSMIPNISYNVSSTEELPREWMDHVALKAQTVCSAVSQVGGLWNPFTQSPIQWLPRALSPELRQWKGESDHSPSCNNKS